MLEPKTEKSAPLKGWEELNSQVSELGLWDDEEQPLPTNVSGWGGLLGQLVGAVGQGGWLERLVGRLVEAVDWGGGLGRLGPLIGAVGQGKSSLQSKAGEEGIG